jgi:Outer membrane protein beta-barrel domain
MSARTIVLRGVAVVGVLAFAAAPARAQKRYQFEATIGGVLMTGYSLGSQDANLTANQTAGGPYTLFKSSTKMNTGGGLDARLGWRATRMLTVEGGLTWTRPQLATALTSDAEGAANVTATENISQYIIEGAVIAALTTRERAFVPFVRGGFGYLRELHDANSLAETGQSIHLGGGFTYWFGNLARQGLGLRVDGRYYLLHNGVNLGKTNRSLGAFSGGVVFGF